MVIGRLSLLGGGIVLALLAGTSCKVLVADNCANQSVPGNEFCREEYGNAAPYCSPCRRELNGCVDSPPFSCQGYFDEVSDNDDETPVDDSSSSSDGGVSAEGTTTDMAGSSSSGGGAMTDESSGTAGGSDTGDATTTGG
ncbi:MAG: hypothetical protein AAF799_47655 [Myxococcota bacterium]